LWTTILKATNDGGCMIAGHFMDLVNDPYTYYNYIKKFPPEAFLSIEEAHAHNLHLAVAYPNPGGDVMNIRTSLRDCTLQVYDMQGRMVHQQNVSDDVTSVDASGWKSGTYVWKLTINNEQLTVEEGKWVK
ncbi:MAG: T9SS type A sorting domain-containing protein, partial [Bacteroidales bacterium]|nr:T9SS type A sorting domain-containing protein [Bacteroidales bacterium]